LTTTADGVAMGKRNELVGGGLRRSRKFDGAEGFEAYEALKHRRL